MMKDSYRFGQIILLIISFLVLMASLYFQYFKGLQPCPLCLMQRLCVVLALCFSLMAVLVTPRRRYVLVVLQMFVAVFGLYFAGRQIWLQSLPPDQLPACLPGLDVLMQYFPWRDVFQALFLGAADCGERSWEWLGLSMPAWSALYFAGLFVLAFLCGRTLYPSRSLNR